MKKTLITLLALGGVAMADSLSYGDFVTFGSYVTKDGVVSSFDDFVGKTRDQITGMGATAADNLAFNNNLTITLNLNSMYASSTPDADVELELTGFSYISRDNDLNPSTGSTVSITIGETTYTSEAAVFTRGTTGYGTVSYVFADAPVITLAENATLGLKVNYAGGTDAANKLGFGAFQGLSGTTIIYGGVWQGAFKVDATVVPEPATATLSLLALAGLAARRRRR